MTLPLNPAMAMTEAPPVMEARRWLAETALPAGLPLINVSQAAPVDPPPEGLRAAIAEAALSDPAAHLYGPVLGLPALRAEVAAQWSVAYGGAIDPAQVAITQGCNQAFCAVMATLAGAGDAVMLPVPWYFNHRMWCTMAGIDVIPLPCGPGMVPDAAEAAARLTDRVRAIVLVTPNNPTGAEYPAATLDAFYRLTRARGIALVVDETYRDFDARSGAPHGLFAEPDWAGTLVHLYSFSKVYRLTGHRVGAIVAAPERLAEVEKFLDTVAICPSQLGQIGALWGMRRLAQWVAGERAAILDRRAAVTEGFARLPGWRLDGCGAYFAWARHPFALPSDAVAKAALAQQGVLMLPGTMFAPEGDPLGTRSLRIAFANVDRAGIGTLIGRLAALDLPRA
jgi:aspartate/methionine/tyrosine aminotransferase